MMKCRIIKIHNVQYLMEIITYDPSIYTVDHPNGAHSAVSSESDCRSRGHKFDHRLVPYFHGDWLWNNFYGHAPSTNSRRAVVSYKQNYVHEVLVNCFNLLSQACPGKTVVRWIDRLDMTIAFDWDLKPQTKQTMDHPDLTVSNFMGNTIGPKRVKGGFAQRWLVLHVIHRSI